MGTRRRPHRHGGANERPQDGSTGEVCIPGVDKQAKDTAPSQTRLPKVSTKGAFECLLDILDYINTSQMLEYYESHLVFTENVDEPLNGDDTNDTVMNDD